MRIFCRIDELSKLNYAKDVELQSQRAQMEAMQVSVTVYRVHLVVKNLGWVDQDLGCPTVLLWQGPPSR